MKVIGKLNHQNNQIVLVALENLPTDPSGGNLVPGKIWFNTTDGDLKYYDGVEVVSLGNSTEIYNSIQSVQDELDFSQLNAGLNTDGSYAPFVGGTYIDVATSFQSALEILDPLMDDSQTRIQALEDTRVLRAGDTMTGDLTMSNGAHINQPIAPTLGNHLANKTYVDGLAGGFDIKASVVAGVTATDLIATSSYVYDNGTGGLGATLTAPNNDAWLVADSDNYAIQVGDRILVKNETTNPEANGIYEVTQLGDGATQPTIFTRATDMDGDPVGEVSGGNFTFIEGGDTLAGNGYTVVWPAGDITVGTDPINWSLTSSAGALPALQDEVDNLEASIGPAVNGDGTWNGFSLTNYLDAVGDLTEALTTLDSTVAGSTFTYDSLGVPDTVHDINHNLGVQYPVVTVYDKADNQVVEPLTITAVDANNIQVTFATSVDAVIVLKI